MLTRVKQFYRALTVKPADIDQKELAKWLDERQIVLFNQMRLFDQYHCQNVARSIRHLAKGQKLDQRLLMQAALLHDIGRQGKYILLVDKVGAVLLAALAPHLAKQLENERPGDTFWQRRRFALHLYFHHAEYGRRLLASAGYRGRLLELVAHHHDAQRQQDCIELRLLRRADGLN